MIFPSSGEGREEPAVHATGSLELLEEAKQKARDAVPG